MVTEHAQMGDVIKVTPSKTEQRKSLSNSSSGDEASDANNNNTSEKVWLYEENIKKLYGLDDNPERQKFLDDFFHYRRTNGLYCKIPVIARKPLDVFQLYNIVQRYGGFEQTMKNRMWSQIARELELPRTMTSGAFTLKLKYIRLLYQFECFKSKKQVNKSILFNEAILNETAKERYDVEENRRQHRYNSMVQSPVDEESVAEHIRRKSTEKEYRNALMRSKSDDPVFMQHHRGYHKCRTPPEFLSSPSPGGNVALPPRTPPMSIHQQPVPADSPYLISSCTKRPYYHHPSGPFMTGRVDDSDLELDDYENSRPSKQARVDLSRFTIDLLETSSTHITLRVRLNDEVYEGILKCSDVSQVLPKSWGYYVNDKQ